MWYCYLLSRKSFKSCRFFLAVFAVRLVPCRSSQVIYLYLPRFRTNLYISCGYILDTVYLTVAVLNISLSVIFAVVPSLKQYILESALSVNVETFIP